VTQFAEYLHLRDGSREKLILSPEHDANIFVDLDGILPRVKEKLAHAAPKLVVFGDIGTGKSQLLRHVEQQLAPEHRFRPVYVVLSGLDRRSRFDRVHALVMQALERPLIDVLQSNDVAAWLDRQSGLTLDMKHALQLLRDPRTKPDALARARAWLKGPGITHAQAHKLGFSGRLTDTAGPAQLVDFWKQIGELYHTCSRDRRALLLLFDEGESIQQSMGPESLRDLGNGFRQVLDPDNRSIGCMFGLNLPALRGGEHPFLRADVERRHDDVRINLQPLGGPERVRAFTERLWGILADPLHPMLTADAINFVGNHLAFLRERAGAAVAGSLKRAPTQADLLVVLNFIAEAAFRVKAALPLSEAALRAGLHIVEA
jgi:hypothetical protein